MNILCQPWLWIENSMTLWNNSMPIYTKYGNDHLKQNPYLGILVSFLSFQSVIKFGHTQINVAFKTKYGIAQLNIAFPNVTVFGKVTQCGNNIDQTNHMDASVIPDMYILCFYKSSQSASMWHGQTWEMWHHAHQASVRSHFRIAHLTTTSPFVMVS